VSLWRRVAEDRRRVVVPLAVLLVVNLAVLALGVWPLQRAVAGQQEQALDVLQRLAAAKLSVEQARSALVLTETADADLRTFYADVLPADFDEAVQVTNFWLVSIARQAGVRFEQAEFGVDREEDSALTQMLASAVLTGDYAGVRRFLHAVETAAPFVIVDRIELAQPGDVTSSNPLELLLDVSTYFLGPGRVTGDRP
jgi:hypothetical protein